VTFRLGDAKTLEQKIASIGSEKWSPLWRHVVDIEDKYIETDYILDEASGDESE
jgi:predicted SAM-dependent methyltransferase